MREVIDVDGARIVFDHGWGLVRASNTQPVLVVRFEADTEARRDEYRRRVEEIIAQRSSTPGRYSHRRTTLARSDRKLKLYWSEIVNGAAAPDPSGSTVNPPFPFGAMVLPWSRPYSENL